MHTRRGDGRGNRSMSKRKKEGGRTSAFWPLLFFRGYSFHRLGSLSPPRFPSTLKGTLSLGTASPWAPGAHPLPYPPHLPQGSTCRPHQTRQWGPDAPARALVIVVPPRPISTFPLPLHSFPWALPATAPNPLFDLDTGYLLRLAPGRRERGGGGVAR